jgi:hypothetical protein
VALPTSPRRAAYSGLALYDTRFLHQRIALKLGPVLARTGLLRLFPRMDPDVDWEWWERWIAEIAEPIIGRTDQIALRSVPYLGDVKVHGILMGSRGEPLGFVKVGGRVFGGMEEAAWGLLASRPPESFRVPACLAAGEMAGVRYRLHQPLPEGPHRRPPFRPRKLWTVIDEYQRGLRDLPRPRGTDPGHAPCHGDLQVINLRVARDGNWWLFDWGGVHWGPRLGDELNYWASMFESRVRPNPQRDADQVIRLLRGRGSRGEIIEAARMLGSQPTNEFRHELYARVRRMASAP